MAEELRTDAEKLPATSTEVKLPGGIWATLREHLKPANICPKAHPAVIVQQLSDRGGTYYVLKNTEEKTYLRLSAQEYDIWEQMDGHRSVQDLVVEHYMTTGEFAHQMIARLVDQLLQHEMLTVPPVGVWSSLQRTLQKQDWMQRVSAPARYLLTRQLDIKNLDRIVGSLYRYGGWLLFTLPAQVLFLLISVLGLAAFFSVLNNTSHVFLGENLIVGLALLWVISIAPVIIHELGHALTVKHYGREVPRGGLMLYFGMPAAFVETTDIWLEPRRARLAVTWNGPYTGLIIGGLASIYMVLQPASSINSILFKLAGFAYLSVFINVNPMIKLDGYYLLSDALNIPLLRERSMAFVRRNLFGKISRREKFSRNEIIFTIFGVLSLAWTAYAIYMAVFFWQRRFGSSFICLQSSHCPLLTRLISLLLVAAMLSFIFLILLQLIQLGRALVERYFHSGGRTHYFQMAGLAALLVLVLGIALPLLLPQYAAWFSVGFGVLFPWLAAGLLFSFLRPYLFSMHGLAYVCLTAACFLVGLGQGAPLLSEAAQIPLGLQAAAVLLLLLANGLITWPPIQRLGLVPILVGILVGFGFLAGAGYLAAVPFSDLRLLLVAFLLGSCVLGLYALQGSARFPAFLLLAVGGLILSVGWLFTWSFLDTGLVGALFLAAGGLHIVLARLPELTAYQPGEITSRTAAAIGYSTAVVVRRVIAQVFFESGWPGTLLLGKHFNAQMASSGLKISIERNIFQDDELPQRSADELVEVYGVVFDALYQLVQQFLGKRMGAMTFGFGVDLLPWQHREVFAELVLSRLDWGRALDTLLGAAKLTRRDLLKRVPLFRNCSDEELDRLAAQLQSEKFAVEDIILQQGEPGDKFYVVERGIVTIWQTDEEGVEHEVDRKGPGQYFGEVALVTQALRNATARAKTPLILLSLAQSDFDQLVRGYVDLANQVDEKVRYAWLLRGMPLFDELDNQDLDWLVSRLEREKFQAGEIIIHEGEEGDKFYLLEAGQVVVTRQVNGETVEISRRKTGDYFGEIALLQQRPRTATVTALIDTRLLSLRAEDFQQMLSKYSGMSQAVTRTGTRRLTFVQKGSVS